MAVHVNSQVGDKSRLSLRKSMCPVQWTETSMNFLKINSIVQSLEGKTSGGVGSRVYAGLQVFHEVVISLKMRNILTVSAVVQTGILIWQSSLYMFFCILWDTAFIFFLYFPLHLHNMQGSEKWIIKGFFPIMKKQ